jgi:tRNA U54 and U55 pseudouridine synthase Pus10
MSILAGVEAELSKLWTEVSGEARAAIETALSDAKAEVSVLEAKAADIEAKLRTALSEAETEIKAAVSAATPGIKSEVEALVAKLISAVEGALGGA